MIDFQKRDGGRRDAPAAPIAAGGKPAARCRPCLACGERFASEGPHERICPPCKDTEEWRDLAAATGGHILW